VLALDEKLVTRLHASAKAERWSVSPGRFGEVLEDSIGRALAGRTPSTRDIERYVSALHLEDLALATACAAGDEAAWEHFIREFRPVLYRSAAVLDASGGARELADSLYADLYGLRQNDGERQSLFRYFHGRSSLATWLRSVLSQRHVDAIRARRRLAPLPEDESVMAATTTPVRDPDAARYQALMVQALAAALERLAPRDRLRLGCYYAQQLTLAETGRLLREHEATVSRQIARTRRAVRKDVEDLLRREGLGSEQIARCLELALEDAGPLDLDDMFAATLGRKVFAPERSQ
jgi:RNA polymerase sigma factor (sigma-70 family)